MKVIHGGVASPKGFNANGIWCGIKRSGKPDLALIASEVPAVAAGVFTKNSVKAAPLILTQKYIKDNSAQAIVCNSGNANCFTGKFGMIYAKKTAELFGETLKIDKKDVLVCSTGIIGKPLPYNKIEKSAKRLAGGLSTTGSIKAAKAIMTTDTRHKEICVSAQIAGKKITIGGCAKGSGMVAPNMATMLAFITTDINISPRLLKQALKDANEISFNRVTIDGCMSTNDMALILANGQAKNDRINKRGTDFNKFVEALKFVCLELAKMMVTDAEGATKFIEVIVKNAKTDKQAKQMALAIANSVLVKTAAFGKNPNWGRVAAAVGSVGIKSVTEDNLKIDFSSFEKKNMKIIVDVNSGPAEAVVYTSDLSYEYVRINVEYN